MAVKEKGPSPRQRLLAAADELFYNEGIHTVGIDRIIDRAGVAKGSLYYNFEGKDDLVREYLLGRHAMWSARVDGAVAAVADPHEKVLAVFDVLGELFRQPDYRGCSFMNAVAEAQPDSAEVKAAANFRAWVHELFDRLVRELGVDDPRTLGNQLVILYDGAVAAAQMDATDEPAATARAMAELLMESRK
jgi:AcrR family transcriptional regulator